MIMCLVPLVLSLIYLTESGAIPQNNTAILISKYAKVAHWGANENESNIQEGRSSAGQSLWTHGSDANVISGQNVKNDIPKVAYHYAVYKNPFTKIDEGKNEKLPAVGEVIQDRFNPRPYFKYGKIPPTPQKPATYSQSMNIPDTDSAPLPSATNFDSVNVAPSTAQPVDLYTSPYTSYNPPPQPKPDNHAISYNYPPTQDLYAPPSMDSSKDMYDYKPKAPEKSQQTSYATLGPPLNFQYGPSNDDMMPPDNDNHAVDAPPSDHIPKYQDDGPPDYPPKSEDDIYYPPYDSGKGHDMMSMTVDHPPTDYKAPPPPPPPSMAMDQSPPSSMTMDLSPPAPDDHGSHFPQYLYDGHHYDHHIYEEVPHTTTEATEDKRVSSGHYSYYYLGRKLWYIPLYFSIYFIVYVTILILKAIARHKIQYKHKFMNTSSRDARQLTSDQIQTIDYLHKNVTNAIDSAKKIYATFSM